MKTLAKSFFLSLVLILIAACGGGGSSAPKPVASTETFNLLQAWVNYLTASQSSRFTVRGTLYGYAVTGSGTYSQSGLQAVIFESQSALRKFDTASLRISVNNENTDLAVTSTLYVDSNYVPLGSEGDDYGVVSSAVTIPAIARVGDNGLWYTETIYPTSAKSYVTGTRRTSFVLEPETASTALLKVIAADTDTGGSHRASTIITFRVTTAGTLTRLSDTTVTADGTLTISY